MAGNPLVSLTTSCARPGATSEVLGFLLASHKRSKMCRSRRLHTRLSARVGWIEGAATTAKFSLLKQ